MAKSASFSLPSLKSHAVRQRHNPHWFTCSSGPGVQPLIGHLNHHMQIPSAGERFQRPFRSIAGCWGRSTFAHCMLMRSIPNSCCKLQQKCHFCSTAVLWGHMESNHHDDNIFHPPRPSPQFLLYMKLLHQLAAPHEVYWIG